MGGAEIAELLRRARLPVAAELELQDAVQRALAAAGVSNHRERALPGDFGRPDFMAGRVAVECKVQGAVAAIAAQLARYARCPEVDEVVLVTSRAVPVRRLSKPLHVVWVSLGAF